MSQLPERPYVSSRARLFFGVTAAIALFGLAVQAIQVGRGQKDFFSTSVSGMFGLLFYFTILSNILVAIACTLLYLNPNRDSTAFRWLRLTSTIGIVVTGVVYHGVLAGLFDLHGLDWLADFILHTVDPVIVVIGWFVFGPRALTSRKVVGLTVIFPFLYGVVTLIRGPIVHWYPYPFWIRVKRDMAMSRSIA